MESMIKYFDQIKADETLKEKTKLHVLERIAADNEKKAANQVAIPMMGKRKFAVKKLSYAAVSVLVLAFLAIGGNAYYKTPVNYISLDINPSVELGLNGFDKVVKVEGLNRDGIELIRESEILYFKAEEAIKELTVKANEEGYIRNDGSTVIAITTQSNHEEKAMELREQLREMLKATLQEKNLKAVIYTDSADLQLRTESRDLGISPGKYKLFQFMQSLDSSVDVDQFRNARISEMILKANELLETHSTTESERYAWNYEMIQVAAKQLQQINSNEMQEQNLEQERNQYASPSAIEQDQELEQNRNQVQNENQIQKESQIQNDDQNGSGSDLGQSQTQEQGTSSPAIEGETTSNQGASQGGLIVDGQETQRGQGNDASDNGKDQGQNSNQSSGEQEGSSNNKDPK